MLDDDLLQEIADMPGIKFPEFRLWLAVFALSLSDLKTFPRNKTAHYWIFDPENIVFDYFCDVLDTEPDHLRNRVRKLLKKPIATP